MNNELKSIDEIEKIILTEESFSLYFYNDNCAPCKSLRPKVIEMHNEDFNKMNLYFVNSNLKDITAKFSIFDYPTLIVFFDKRETIRVSKYVSMVQLKEQMARYYNIIFDSE